MMHVKYALDEGYSRNALYNTYILNLISMLLLTLVELFTITFIKTICSNSLVGDDPGLLGVVVDGRH